LYPATVFKWLHDVTLQQLPLPAGGPSAKSPRAAKAPLKAELVLLMLRVLRDSEDGELAMLRTRMLVEGLAFAAEKARENLLARTDSAKPLRHLFHKLSANAPFLHEKLLPHLVANHRHPDYDANATKHLGAFHAQFPLGKWVSWENIRAYHRLREHAPTLFRPMTGYLQASARRTTGSWWGKLIDVDGDNQFELVSAPLLKRYAFFLAALGLVEIAFDPPANTHYCRQRRVGAALPRRVSAEPPRLGAPPPLDAHQRQANAGGAQSRSVERGVQPRRQSHCHGHGRRPRRGQAVARRAAATDSRARAGGQDRRSSIGPGTACTERTGRVIL
jgi:hypothetical protein